MSNNRVDEKIQETKDEISDLRLKRFLTMTGALGMGAFIAAGSSLLYTTFSEMVLPFALFTSFIPAGMLYSYGYKGNQKRNLEKRLSHLEKINKEGIDKNEYLDKKRSNLIGELEDKQDDLAKPMNRAAVMASISGLLWALGSAVTLVNPLAAWATFAGMLGFGISTIAEDKNLKKYFGYQTRIDNLKDDLIYGPILDNGKGKSMETVSKKDSSKVAGKAIVNPNYQREVDQYVESLDGIGEETTSYQYKK